MRARFYPVGHRQRSEVVSIDVFPVIVSKDDIGNLLIAEAARGEPLCLIDEFHGNLIIKDCVVGRSVTVNGLPIIQGGLMPGDTLAVEDDSFVVSYERITATSPIRACYHIA